METLKDNAQTIEEFINDFQNELNVAREKLSYEWSRKVGSEREQLANYMLFDLYRSIDALNAQCQTLNVLLVKMQCEKQEQ